MAYDAPIGLYSITAKHSSEFYNKGRIPEKQNIAYPAGLLLIWSHKNIFVDFLVFLEGSIFIGQSLLFIEFLSFSYTHIPLYDHDDK